MNNLILHQNPRIVNLRTQIRCDTCSYPVGTVIPFTVDSTTRNCCLFCRHSLNYANLGNITSLINRFFAEVVK